MASSQTPQEAILEGSPGPGLARSAQLTAPCSELWHDSLFFSGLTKYFVALQGSPAFGGGSHGEAILL